MSINIEALRHLLAISFAVDLAYIALNRFRYYHVCRDKLLRAEREVAERLKEVNPAGRDTSLSRIARKHKDMEGGLGPKLFGTKIFGGKDKTGCDVSLISIFASLQYITLLLNCVFDFGSGVYWAMLVISILGTTAPIILIAKGTAAVSEIEEFISRVLKDVSDTYTIPIAIMEENLSKAA